MLSCKEVTESLERIAVEKLSPVTRMQMNMHLKMCSACQKYKEQNETLDQILKVELSKQEKECLSKTVKLSDVKKSEIIELMKNEK
jgi:anti-sigma factor ChrR (cupin superfamily)